MILRRKAAKSQLAAEIWQENESYIRRLCAYKLRGMPGYVEDCMQDTFLALTVALNRGEEIQYPKAWLTRVAGNKINDVFAQVSRRRAHTVSFDEEILEQNLIKEQEDFFAMDDEQIEQLKDRVLSMLSEDDRRLLYDRYTLKKSAAELAEEYQTTENNIYQRIFRLKQKTKLIIDNIL